MKTPGVGVLLACLIGAGCGLGDEPGGADGRDDAFLGDGKTDGLGPNEGSLEALAILEIVNTLSVEALDADEAVGLDGRAARSIGARRNGPDELPGTDDDFVFEFLWELDAVPYVGKVAFSRLLTYAYDQDYMVPPIVDIHVVGAVIGVGVAEGIEWDSFAPVAPDLIAGVLDALFGPNPYTSILVLLATPVVQSMSAPDPLGTARLDGGSTIALGSITTNTENTFQPVWPGNPGWTGVDFDDNTRITIALQDEDVIWSDDIGIAQLNAVDIRNAWRSQQVFPVDVSDQTDEQLLFVRISVTAP